jgi:hypothetical protein
MQCIGFIGGWQICDAKTPWISESIRQKKIVSSGAAYSYRWDGKFAVLATKA